MATATRSLRFGVLALAACSLLSGCKSEGQEVPPKPEADAQTAGWIALDGSKGAQEQVRREISAALARSADVSGEGDGSELGSAVASCLHLYGSMQEDAVRTSLTEGRIEFAPRSRTPSNAIAELRSTPDRSWSRLREGSLRIRKMDLQDESPLLAEVGGFTDLPANPLIFEVRHTVTSTFGPELEVAWCLIAKPEGGFLHPLAWETRNGPVVMAYRIVD